MMIDLEVVAKALNSIDLDDLLESYKQVTEVAKFMKGESEREHPLNQAMMRIFTNQPFMEAMQRKADRLGVELDAVLFPMLQGLLVGLITPVPMPTESVPDHQWEPDFSEGEPFLDSKICGLCGKEHS